MEGTDVEQYKDEYKDNDHTYYGNGCPNDWVNEPPLYGGSTKSCNKRVIGTNDGENQKIGTYYNFQAATDGIGGAITTNNTNSPDTFCPLGWQLPYGGSGGDYYDQSKSWSYLYGLYNILDHTTGSATLRSYPFSYIYSGYYYWIIGVLYLQELGTRMWPLTVYNNGNSYRMYIGPTAVRTNGTDSKAVGFALRCSE